MQLSLNRQRISLTYKLFGLESSYPLPARRKDITKLEYIKKPVEYDFEGAKIGTQSQINIWVGTQNYKIGNSNHPYIPDLKYNFLTQSELDWLAYELSDWLGMPIIKG